MTNVEGPELLVGTHYKKQLHRKAYNMEYLFVLNNCDTVWIDMQIQVTLKSWLTAKMPKKDPYIRVFW